MTLRNDRWGEPIDQVRHTYSLATLFRVLTIVAGFCGWLSVPLQDSLLSIDFPHHDIERANDGRDVGDQTTAAQLGRD